MKVMSHLLPISSVPSNVRTVQTRGTDGFIDSDSSGKGKERCSKRGSVIAPLWGNSKEV